MKTIHATMFATAMAVSLSMGSVQAENTSAESMLVNISGNYMQLSQRGEWVNPWMPAATGTAPVNTMSADRQLTNIVTAYTRESLDRGGWLNAFLDNSHYASGNPLLATHIGEGVTELRSISDVSKLTVAKVTIE